MNLNNLKGEISEAKIRAALCAAGYLVVLPAAHRRWDIGYEKSDKLVKLQCKTGKIIKDVITFRTSSISRSGKRISYRNQIDFFAVYVPENDKVYIIPVDTVGTNLGSLRLSPPKNNQKKKVLYAKDFELGRLIATS